MRQAWSRRHHSEMAIASTSPPLSEVSRPAPRSRGDRRRQRAIDERARRVMAALTALCLVGLAAGWIAGSAALLPRTAIPALYALAYVAGGSYSTRRALLALRAGVATVDL